MFSVGLKLKPHANPKNSDETQKQRRDEEARAEREFRLEAEVEADGGFVGAHAASDGEVVLEEVGREVDELAEADASAEVASGEVVFEAEVVVVDGAVLLGQALAAADGGLEADGAAAGSGVSGNAEGVEGQVGDVAESEFADGGLGATEEQVLAGRRNEGVVLSGSDVAEVELEADVRLGDVAEGDEFSDRAAGLDGEQGVGGGGVALFDPGDGGAEAAGSTDGEVNAIELLHDGGDRGGFGAGILSDRLDCWEAEEAQQESWEEQARSSKDRSAKRNRHVERTPLRRKITLL